MTGRFYINSVKRETDRHKSEQERSVKEIKIYKSQFWIKSLNFNAVSIKTKERGRGGEDKEEK